MNDYETKQLNKTIFSQIDTCKCGTRNGAYLVKEDDGWYYRCNDCDLPLKDSYHLNQSYRSRYDDEYID